MTAAFSWFAAAAAGLVLGLAFFSSLRVEVRGLMAGGPPAVFPRMLRLLAPLAVFGVAAKMSAAAVLIALAAFHIGGAWILVRRAATP